MTQKSTLQNLSDLRGELESGHYLKAWSLRVLDQAISDHDELVAALERLKLAASDRENTMGDPMRLIEVQAELRDATEEARIALAKAKP